MPAITVDDITVLPRIPDPDPTVARERPVKSLTTAPSGFEGEGFPVRRAFAGVDLADLDPFIHLDQMGEVEYAPGEPKGTPWHPHRGFETVTYMIDGMFEHQDSNGGGGVITNGDTQWMTAGAGILHIEKPPEWLVASGGLFHGFQLWVNLPRDQKWSRAALPGPPGDRGRAARRRPTAARSSGSSPARSPATPAPGSTYTPMTLVHATLSPGRAADRCPWRADYNALVYVLAGSRDASGARSGRSQTGQLAVFGAGQRDHASTPSRSRSRAAPNLDVLILGGRPIREPVAWMGPFVMNTRDEVIQAVRRLPGRPPRARSRRSTTPRRTSSSRARSLGRRADARHGSSGPTSEPHSSSVSP